MKDDELNKAIEVAGEAVYGGFAEDDSFECLLSRAVLELASRLQVKPDAYLRVMEEVESRAILDYEGLRKDEPVACGMQTVKIDASAPLVMTPNPAFQKRTWVGLTEYQIDELEKEFIGFSVPNIYNFVQAIEAKLKEKNT
jgi:hypothetical protein